MPYQRQEYYQPSRVDTGQAELYGTLADRLGQWNDRAKAAVEEVAIPRAEQAGTEAAAAGNYKTRSPITKVNRAYNDAMIRAYALDTYASVHQKVSELELAAGTDLTAFKTSVDGYRKGLIPSLLPQARPIIEAALQERVSQGSIRVGTLAANEQKAEMVASSDRGRQVMQDQISRMYTSGDPEQIAAAAGLSNFYLGSLEGDVAAGILTHREAVAKADLFHKDVTRQVAIGNMEAELEKPGGDPVGVIEHTLEQASPILSDEEKMSLVGSMFGRLNAHQALTTERLQAETQAHQAQWAAGEKLATVLQLQGKMSLGILARMVHNDQLDPAIARSIESSLKSGGGSGNSDQELVVGLNLLAYTEQEIYTNPDLSNEAKFKFIKERRNQEEGWRSTQAGVEGAARIDRALNIVPGTNMNTLTDAQKRARGEALGEWYDRVEAMPDDERNNAAIIDKAMLVIDKVINRNSEMKVEGIERRKEAFIKSQPPRDSMDEAERVEFDRSLGLYDANIAAARRESKARPHR